MQDKNTSFETWLKEHLTAAKIRYEEICKLDEQELTSGGESSEHFEQGHQMFGYIAALETCLKQLKPNPKPKKKSK